MSGLLLDTNILLLAMESPERLSRAARRAIETGPSYISVISYWEVAVKSGKGNLAVGDVRQWWATTVEAMGLRPIAFRPEHVAEIATLPAHHSDPFDRALIAQAVVEELTLVTTDRAMAQYEGEKLRLLQA